MLDVKIKADNHRDGSNFEDFQILSEDTDESLVERRPGYQGEFPDFTGKLVELSYLKFFAFIMDTVQSPAPELNDYECIDIDVKSLYSRLSKWRKRAILIGTSVWVVLTLLISLLALFNPILWILTMFYLILLPLLPLALFLVVGNRPREEFMVNKIVDAVEKEDVQTVSAFIGSFHAPKVKCKLESEGVKTEVISPNGLARYTFTLYESVIYAINRIKKTFSDHLL